MREEYKRFKIEYENACRFFRIEDDSIDEKKLEEMENLINENINEIVLKYQEKIPQIILIEFYTSFLTEFMPRIKYLNSKCENSEYFPPILLGEKTKINRSLKQKIFQIFQKYNYAELKQKQDVPLELLDIVSIKDVFLEKNTKRSFPDPMFDHSNESWKIKEEKIIEKLKKLLLDMPSFYEDEINDLLYLFKLREMLNKSKPLFLELNSKVDGIFMMADVNMEIYFERNGYNEKR